MANESVKFANLPGVYSFKNDGNLVPEAANPAPRTVVIGTAARGQSSPYLVSTTSAAKSEFGAEGTLFRGMWEAKKGGAAEIMLLRVGATASVLSGVGDSSGAGGYIIETVLKDDTAGDLYKLYYVDAEDRLVISRVSDDLVIFDNNPDAYIDRFEVIVSGSRPATGGVDIGSPSAMVVLSDIDPSTYAGTSFSAGTDGVDLSRMEMFEKLYVAYKELLNQNFDVLVPMDVYLDDYNIVDQGHYLGAVAPVLPGSNTYPTPSAFRPGVDVDSLGLAYVEEFEGNYYFWWRTSTGAFTAADLYPATDPTGNSYDLSTKKLDGTDLAAEDFHEVNFGYQLARFLYEYSTNIVDATGTIGVLPPNSNSLVDRARWVGKAPTVTVNTITGEENIAASGDNGYGLLGNKFMAGRSDWRSGVVGGGLIATESEWLDSGDELLDDNDVAVDLGKYISVVVDYPLLRNSFNPSGYIASFAASYAGFYVDLNPASAPTNKVVANTTVVYRINVQDLDRLAGAGYVSLRQKPQGVVIADAPTAALPTSDWKRLSTVRIVKTVIDDVRSASEPYLGEALSQSKKSALENAIEQKALVGNKKAGLLKDYREFTLIQTPDLEVQGRANVILTLIPAFELRQIVLTVNLSKSS